MRRLRCGGLGIAVLAALVASGGPMAAGPSGPRLPPAPAPIDHNAPARQASPTVRPQQAKDQFVGAIRAFLEATAGQYGDEGATARKAIDEMDQALGRWDQAVLADEATAASQAPSAELHRNMGLVYLDRRRVADALREFDLAEQLDPRRPDIHTLRGFAYDVAGQPGDAVVAFAQAADLNPADPTTSYRLAQRLTSQGHVDQSAAARQRFRESELANLAQTGRGTQPAAPFIRVDLMRQSPSVAPIFPQARYRDGFTAVGRGRYGDAVSRFKAAADHDPLLRVDGQPGPPDAGTAALRRGQLPEAIALLGAAAKASPEGGETLRALGMAYWADDQYDRAIEQFAAAIRLRNDDERARVALGDTLVAAGKLGGAEQAFTDAIRAIPGSGQAHYDLGRLYEFQQRWPEAATMYETAANLTPVAGLDNLYRSIVRMYLALPDFDKAIGAAGKRIEVNPNNAEAHRALGDLLLREGRHEEALTELLAALLVDPRDAEAYSGMAQAYLRTARFAEAEQASRRAVDIDPLQRMARYTLAIALTRIGRAEEGAKELQRFQELQAESQLREERDLEVKMLQQEVSTSLAKEDFAAAIAALQKLIPYDPRSAASHLNLGVVLKKAGRVREAIESLEKARELGAGPDVYRLLADAYEAAGRVDESRENRTLYERAKAERTRTAAWTR